MTATPIEVATDRVPHRGPTAALTLGVPAAALAGTTALALAWRPVLPDPLASHWGPDGADGFSAFWPLVGGTGTIVAVFAVAMWFVGTRLGHQAVTRRFAVGSAVWLAVFVCGVLLALLSAQRGVADASTVRSSGLVEAGVFAGATILAVAAGRLMPGDPPRPTSAPVPIGAPTLDLGDHESAAWLAEVGRRSSVPAVAGALAFGGFLGAATQMWLFAGLLTVALGLLLVTMLRWTVTVDAHGLTARSLLRRPRFHVPLDEVEQAEVVHVQPMSEFGGYGLRVGLDGRAGVVLRKGEAIQVRRTGDRVVVVTVDDARTGAALLNTLAARHRQTR